MGFYTLSPVLAEAKPIKYTRPPVIANGQFISCEAINSAELHCNYINIGTIASMLDDVITYEDGSKRQICKMYYLRTTENFSNKEELTSSNFVPLGMTCKQLAQNIDDAFKYVGLK